MKHKELKIDFRYLGGNIACLSADSINGKEIHNDIDNDEAIIIFNSLVGEKENCITVKTLQQENQLLKEQLQQRDSAIEEAIEFINKTQYDPELKNQVYGINYGCTIKLLDILNKYKKEVSE